MISKSIRCVVTVVSIAFFVNMVTNLSVVAISVVSGDVVINSIAIIQVFTSAVNVTFAFAVVDVIISIITIVSVSAVAIVAAKTLNISNCVRCVIIVFNFIFHVFLVVVCFFIDYKGPTMIQLGHSLNIMSNDFQPCELCFSCPRQRCHCCFRPRHRCPLKKLSK